MKDARGRCRRLINRVLSVLLLIALPAEATIDASVDYEVEGNGFHRTIRYHVDTGNFFKENCYVALTLSPDPTLYANVDELADLRRRGETTVCSDGEIDVEVFAEKAGHQNITICAPLKASGNFLSLPLHQRYQMPRMKEEYVNITLPQPALLLGCKERIKEYPVSKIDLCAPCVDLSIKWREIPYEMKPNDFVWMVPVGELADLNYITWRTIFTVWFGTLVLLRTLWHSRESEDNDNDKDKDKKD